MAIKEQAAVRKRVKKRRLTWILVIFFLVLLFFFLQRGKHTPKTITLEKTQTYQAQVEGRGAFVFYEYAPSFLQDAGEKLVVSKEVRLPTDCVLFVPEKPLLSRIQNLLEKKEALSAKEHDYAEAILKRGEVFLPNAGMVMDFTDGLESVCTIEGLSAASSFTWSALHTTTQPGIKFVENREFYLSFLSRSGNIDWSLNRTYSMQVEDGWSFEGKLVAKRTEMKGVQLVFQCEQHLQDAVRRRLSQLVISDRPQEVYRLPYSAVWEEEGKYYCYVETLLHQYEKTVVEVVDADLSAKQWIVSSNSKSEDENELRYLQRFDRVVQDASTIVAPLETEKEHDS